MAPQGYSVPPTKRISPIKYPVQAPMQEVAAEDSKRIISSAQSGLQLDVEENKLDDIISKKLAKLKKSVEDKKGKDTQNKEKKKDMWDSKRGPIIGSQRSRNQELPRRIRSRSGSPRRFRSRSGSPRRIRSRSRSTRRIRSRSPSTRRIRSRSPSTRRIRSRSPSTRRIRSRSPSPKRYYKPPYKKIKVHARSRTRSRSPRRYNARKRSRSRSLSPLRSRRSENLRSRSRERKRDVSAGPSDKINNKWPIFSAEFERIQVELTEKYDYYTAYPEKHPKYTIEWKNFWSSKYQELLDKNKDPINYDFKPEWAKYWAMRAKDLHEEELQMKKDELKDKYGLFGREECESPPKQNRPVKSEERVIVLSGSSSDDKINSRKHVTNTKKITHKDSQHDSVEKHVEIVKRLRDRMQKLNHKDNENDPVTKKVTVIGVLQVLTAMETQLGSLGPQINALLAQALLLEKLACGSSQSLLDSPDNVMLFEIVREKLKGQIVAGIPQGTMKTATMKCIDNLNNLLESIQKNSKSASVIKDSKKKKKDVTVNDVLQVLSAMETQLGSLGPRMNTLLAETLHLEKSAPGSSQIILNRPENVVLFEMVREKLKGQIVAGIVQGAVLTATEKCIGDLNSLLENPKKDVPAPIQSPEQGDLVVDKVGIAQQIAAALVAKGKTDVSQEELRQLIDSIVGTTQSSDQEEQNAKNYTVAHKQSDSEQVIMQASIAENINELSEDDLKTLLQNYKDLSSEEQQCLITYLKRIEDKVKSNVNPVVQSYSNPVEVSNISPKSDNSDEDSSFKAMYAAVSKKVKEREMAEQKLKSQCSNSMDSRVNKNVVASNTDFGRAKGMVMSFMGPSNREFIHSSNTVSVLNSIQSITTVRSESKSKQVDSRTSIIQIPLHGAQQNR